MDLQQLRIDLRAQSDDTHPIHLRVIDQQAGEPDGAAAPRLIHLDHQAASGTLHAAEPLLVRLAQEGEGPVLGLWVDFPSRTLRALCLADGHDAPEQAADGDELDLYLGALPSGGPDDHRNSGEVGEVPPHLCLLVLQGADFVHVASLLREIARHAVRAARPRLPEDEAPAAATRWERRYHNGGDGWELWRPAPPLERYLRQHPLASLCGQSAPRALVPGAGRGHDARLLARLGAQVTAVDFAAAAVAACRRLNDAEGVAMDVRQADLFDLPAQEPGRYDLLLEHTLYCAIDPARRPDYAQAAATLLRPGGVLLGLFWAHAEPGGPPFSATPDELRERFARDFVLRHHEVPDDSVATRAHQELLLVLQRR